MSAISSRRSPQRGHARTSKPKLRCINSAHSEFVRGGIDAAGRDDDSTAVVPRPPAIAVSGSRACRRDRHADRAPSTPSYGSRLIRGRGVSAASRSSSSTGSKSSCVVPSAHRCRRSRTTCRPRSGAAGRSRWEDGAHGGTAVRAGPDPAAARRWRRGDRSRFPERDTVRGPTAPARAVPPTRHTGPIAERPPSLHRSSGDAGQHGHLFPPRIGGAPLPKIVQHATPGQQPMDTPPVPPDSTRHGPIANCCTCAHPA